MRRVDMDDIVSVKGLTKKYKNKIAVDNVDFEIKYSEIVGFIGPNGAGKSTTMNILCGVIPYNSGSVKYEGVDIKRCYKKYKSELGVVPQDLALYEDLSCEKNVRFFASLYGFKGKELDEKVENALKRVALLEHKRDIVKTFSGGMKRRLNIACAIAHEPKFLIMDEPTVGIDPQSRNHILNFVRKAGESGMSVLYTTHYMEEIEAIASRIYIIDHGSIIAQGTLEELKEKYFKRRRLFVDISEEDELKELPLGTIEGIHNILTEKHRIVIDFEKEYEILDKVINCIVAHGFRIINISYEKESIESLFLNLTGRSLRD